MQEDQGPWLRLEAAKEALETSLTGMLMLCDFSGITLSRVSYIRDCLAQKHLRTWTSTTGSVVCDYVI